MVENDSSSRLAYLNSIRRTVYNVCYPNPMGPEAEKLYDHYRKTFEDYISSKVGEL